ncbi:MAG TPA: GNAT family N-acetyltransferase [Acidimicrobiaceae bacterium]|nr:GNAT family N-acetyltransferase [Acidimicrobiaceae bacterium]
MPRQCSYPNVHLPAVKPYYSQSMEKGIQIRLAKQKDAETIREIYNHEVRNSTATFDLVERTTEEQEEWLTERSGAFSVLVAEMSNKILGFASLSPYKSRAAYRTTVEDSIYINEEFRNQGIAGELLFHLLEVAKSSGFHAVIARIGGANEASIALHQRFDFEIVGTEKEIGRKFGKWQDVVVMQRIINAGGPEPK